NVICIFQKHVCKAYAFVKIIPTAEALVVTPSGYTIRCQLRSVELKRSRVASIVGFVNYHGLQASLGEGLIESLINVVDKGLCQALITPNGPVSKFVKRLCFKKLVTTGAD